MSRILIVEDEPAMRELLRERLRDCYEVMDTGDPSEALALVLQHKPDCILLDLMMPNFSGFELCQTLSSLSATRLIPIFIVSANPAVEYKTFCLSLGAKEYIEKPVDFSALKTRLAEVLKTKQVERRTEIRARLRVMLKLKGTDTRGVALELPAVTEDVSASGFLCACQALLQTGAIVEVFLTGDGMERRVGRARVARVELPNTPGQRCGFQFVEKPRDWILR